MKRLISSSVTDALMSALEHADEMENVLIVAWNKDNSGSAGGQSFSDEEMTTAQCLMIMKAVQAASALDDGSHAISVEPYPLKPVQNPRPDPAIMASIMSRTPGIGAKPGMFGRSQSQERHLP